MTLLNRLAVACALAFLCALILAFAVPARAQAWAPVDPAATTLTGDGIAYNVQNGRKPWSLLRDVASNSYRMECRSGDEWANDAGRSPLRDRSEIGSQQKLVPGVPYTVRFSLETGGVPRAGAQTILTQEHATDDAGQPLTSWPIWSFEFSDGYGLRIRSSSASKLGAPPIGRTLYQSWKWSNGVPHKVVVRFTNDHGEGRGAIAASIDGVKVVDQANIPLGYPTQRGPYLKFGCYRFRAVDKVTATYRDLTGPIANDPAPLP